MTDNNIWRLRRKKKSISIPLKQATTPTQPVAQPAPKAVKPVKANKVKKVKAQAQLQSTQQPQLQLSDFRILTTADSIGIHIIMTYLGTPIHQFILPAAQYGNWQKSPPQAKYNYVQARTLASVFFGDMRLVHVVVTATVNAIDNLFLRARQAQAQ